MVDPLGLFSLEPISLKAIFLPFYSGPPYRWLRMSTNREIPEENRLITENKKLEKRKVGKRKKNRSL